MARSLITNVEVAGRWYGPEDDVPAHVAEQITNPKVWRQDDDADAKRAREETAARAGTSSGARLARYVEVGGTTYGPDDPISDDVAAQITNPSAWEGRRLPAAARRAAERQARERTAPTPPALPGSGTPAVRAGEATGNPRDHVDDPQGPAAPQGNTDGNTDGDDGDGGGDVREGAAPPPEGNRPVPPAKKATPRKATGSGA